jgi:hypothetical protein
MSNRAMACGKPIEDLGNLSTETKSFIVELCKKVHG